ncbi:HAMP domain-containing sensor histidine kinase [Oceanobacillus halophilus]|nr:ATP-binding protein [Oceanobacillus halophilus]
MKKWRKSLLPNEFLWRLTFVNIVVISSFIILSSWAIYHTACFLADGMSVMSPQKQNQFNITLFQYLWLLSVPTIFIGSFIHFYITKKMTQPLKDMIDSTKEMKEGQFPKRIEANSAGEIGQLIGHFNDLVQQLKDNEEHRKKLISDLSHEFRTPLTNINGYLKALENGVLEGDKELYRSLYLESKRLTSMLEQLDQLKEWDHISKQSFMQKEKTDIGVLIEQSVDMFQLLMAEKDMKASVQIEPQLVHVYVGGITQVISNLIDNAIRYYEGEGPIRIKGEVLNTEYRLSVSGPGLHIPDNERDKIFERMYRVDPSRSQETGGRGLGLAISKEIIGHHHGNIGLESNEYYHSFWFTLPISD